MYRMICSSEFRPQLSDCLTHVSITGERFLITRNGKDVAGLVTVHDLDRLEQVDAHSEEMMEARHRRLMAEFKRLKGLG